MPLFTRMRAVVASLVMVVLVLGSASPVAAVDLPLRPFALWPPHYCGASWGSGAHVGGFQYGIGAATFSLKAAGSDGACNDASPAPANTFAALARLQVYFAPSGGWVLCTAADHAPNPAGSWGVASAETLYGCGAAPHRLWAGSRITYGGNNYHDDRYTGVL